MRRGGAWGCCLPARARMRPGKEIQDQIDHVVMEMAVVGKEGIAEQRVHDLVAREVEVNPIEVVTARAQELVQGAAHDRLGSGICGDRGYRPERRAERLR